MHYARQFVMENRYLTSQAVSVTFLLLIFTITACGSMQTLTSSALQNEITIDGEETDWIGILKPVEKENFSLGFTNDDEYLYVSFITGSPLVQHAIIRQGLAIWFNRDGEKDKHFGIRYPIGLFSERAAVGPEVISQNPSLAEQYFKESLEHFELFQNDFDKGTKYSRRELDSVDLLATLENGTFVYELKIPMKGTGLQALNATAGEITVGIETPKLALDRSLPDPSITSAERSVLITGTGPYAGAPTGMDNQLKYSAKLMIAE